MHWTAYPKIGGTFLINIHHIYIIFWSRDCSFKLDRLFVRFVKFRKWHTCNWECYRLYRSYENCKRPVVAILDMQMSKLHMISGYGLIAW